MLRRACFGLFVIAMMVSGLWADPFIESVEVNTSGVIGGYAIYTAPAGPLVYGDGVFGALMDDAGGQYYFDDVEFDATFSPAHDTSSGGQARAWFEVGTWSMTFIHSVFPAEGYTATISGTLWGSSTWVEEETDIDTDFLLGKGFVSVNTADFLFDDGSGAVSFAQWQGDSLGGLMTQTSLEYGAGITDFLSDYNSENVDIFLYADETLIPEPVSVLLLGLGAIGAICRKRA